MGACLCFSIDVNPLVESGVPIFFEPHKNVWVGAGNCLSLLFGAQAYPGFESHPLRQIFVANWS